MLETIKAKLRPLFMRKYGASRLVAHRTATDANLSEREREIYMSGFEHGWMRGAVDAAAVKPSDLRPQTKKSKLH